MKFIKKNVFFLFIISLLLFIGASRANADSGHDKSIDGVIAEILEAQDANSVENIDCDKITDSRLEELGEAVMSTMHPDEEQHEIMDQMMGGEGSQSLKNMHIIMAQRYLGCSDYEYMGMGSNMMGGIGMMGGIKDYNYDNFDSTNNNTLSPALTVLLWLFLILGIIAFIKIIFNKKS